ncbi:MAG: glycosyltransferase [Patescibacteria group bacterium]
MSDSIHTARWLSQITDQGWDIHLFPSMDLGVVHPELNNINVHHSVYGTQANLPAKIKLAGIPIFSSFLATGIRFILRKFFPSYRAKQLARLIRNLNPDLIHSMETQHAGYLMLEALNELDMKLPAWIHSIWGSDLYLFAKLKGHQAKIREVLTCCKYLWCEGQRDIKLARDLGFKGTSLPALQATGGLDINKCLKLRSQELPSKRKIVILKGNQGWAGRALIGLQALAKCTDFLKNYKLVIYSVSPNSEVEKAAKVFFSQTGIPITIILKGMKYEELLKIYGRARLSLALSISDGVPNSLLESMVMGAFPIQSNTSMAEEWIIDRETGFLTPPEDLQIIQKAISTAMTNDVLIDSAAEKNLMTIKSKLDYNIVKKQVIKIYLNILDSANLHV